MFGIDGNGSTDQGVSTSDVTQGGEQNGAVTGVEAGDIAGSSTRTGVPPAPETEKHQEQATGTGTSAGGATPLPADVQARLDRLAELEGFSPVFEQLRQEGFTSAEDVRNSLFVREEINRLEQETFDSLQVQVDTGVLTPEQAQAQFNRERDVIARDVQGKLLLRQQQQNHLDSAVGTAIDAYPDTLKAAGTGGRDLVRTLALTTGQAPVEIAKFVDGLLTGHAQRAVSAYVAKHGNNSAPTPQGGGVGSVAPPGGTASANDSWSSLLSLGK